MSNNDISLEQLLSDLADLGDEISQLDTAKAQIEENDVIPIVLQAVRKGASWPQIGDRLHISKHAAAYRYEKIAAKAGATRKRTPRCKLLLGGDEWCRNGATVVMTKNGETDSVCQDHAIAYAQEGWTRAAQEV